MFNSQIYCGGLAYDFKTKKRENAAAVKRDAKKGGALTLTDVQFSGAASKRGLLIRRGVSVVVQGTTVINGEIRLGAGGTLRLDNTVPPLVRCEGVRRVNGQLVDGTCEWATLTHGAAATPAAQCASLAGKYTNLSDSWRATTHQTTKQQFDHNMWMGDAAGKSGSPRSSDGCHTRSGKPEPNAACHTGVGGGRWYRFVGPGGDALPLTPPRRHSCGSDGGIWLSGAQSDKRASETDNTKGRYPLASEGVVTMTACNSFLVNGHDSRRGHACEGSFTIGVIRCDNFLLWRLPYSSFDRAYCTVPSGL